MAAGARGGSNYDVFLSFRGPDTRHGFVDCLYQHMTDAGIRVFIDNEKLHVGEVIGDELIRAINHSKICIPVFSKRYASSKWCLLELQHIMTGHAAAGLEVQPVFYDVSPYDVKLQTSLYRDDLEKLKGKHGADATDRWRKSLIEVCKIKGWNLEESQGQGKLIKRIVQEVLYKTKKRHKNIPDHLVGIDSQVEEVMNLLDDGNDHVRFVVIHGMGGIGKTTLAKVVFNEVSANFQGRSFLSDVRKSSEGNGILKLQQQLLNDVLRTSESIYDADEGINEIRDRCSNQKTLLVLDDVDQICQVQKLAGMFDWFGRGSRIIITTRDDSVIPIRMRQEDDSGDVCYYRMPEMNDQHAMTLLKRHAFSMGEDSIDDGELLHDIVAWTGGLPLSLEVVGSYLFGQTEAIWRETLRKLKKTSPKEVLDALMISYEALEDNHKQIFLDIACFFQGIDRRLPMYVWESSDLYPKNGMNVLLQKSLIKIDDKGRIWMHDQLIDLGGEIVQREGKASRVWIHKDAFEMISNRKGTSDVVLLDLGELSESCKFKKSEFKGLANLRVLQLSGGNLVGDFSNCIPQLRLFSWSSFPSNFQAKNFNLLNLVVLRLEKTDIDIGWTGWNQILGSKLKVLELSGCGGLTRTPDLSACLGLEMLYLQHCSRLTEIDDSIGKLQQLTDFVIQGSPNLKGLPDSLTLLKRIEKISVIGITEMKCPVKFHLPICFDDLKSLRHLEIEFVGLESLAEGIGRLKLLEYLSLRGCARLTSLPESVCELESLRSLNLGSTGLMSFSGQIENMKELKVLNMSQTEIRTLPKGIGSLAKLEELDVSCCTRLKHIPSEIGNLFSLRVLNLRATSIVELPFTISRLSRLQHLDMNYCSMLRKVEQLPVNLSHLNLPYFSLQVVPDLSNLVNLIDLSLFYHENEKVDVDLLPLFRSLDFRWIERMRQLKRLVIGVPVDIFNSLQVDWSSLSSVELEISCSDAQSLSQLPSTLYSLVLIQFQSTILQMSLYPNLKNLVELSMKDLSIDEIELRGLEVLGNLKFIMVCLSKSLMRLSISSSPKKLNTLGIMSCPKLVEVQGLERLESLHVLWFDKCPLLSRLPDFPNLVKIKRFRISHCNSMESMPALPRTQHPFHLLVTDCGKLRDFSGPHHLYWESHATRKCFCFLFSIFSFLTSCFGPPI